MDRRSKKFVFVIDKFEFTVPFAIFVIENTNCIVADLMCHKAKRHNRKYLVIEHSIKSVRGLFASQTVRTEI